METTSDGGKYGAIPLITDSEGNALLSVDQCRAAHVERDSKPKARQGASAMRQEPEKRERVFRGYRIVEPEEAPHGGRELYQMEEDEGLPEIAVVYEDEEGMVVDEHGGEEQGYEYGGDELMYECGGELGGYNDYDMEARLRYDAGPQCHAVSAHPPEFFQTLPTLAPSACGLQGAPGAYHSAAVPNVHLRPHSHEPQLWQASNGPPSFP